MKRTRTLTFNDVFMMKKEAEERLWTARILCSAGAAMISVTIGVAILIVTLNVEATIILTALTFIGIMIFMEKYEMDDEKRRLNNARKLVKFINSDEEEIEIIE